MPEVDSYPPGAPCWMDLVAADRDEARRFYTGLFGWDISEGSRDYLIARLGGRTVAGMSVHPDDGLPPGWTTYFSCPNAGELARGVTAAGGEVITLPAAEEGDGAVTTFRDPTGAVAGGWRAGRVAGAQLVREPGTLLFSELRTSEVDVAADFYAAVLPLQVTRPTGDTTTGVPLRNLRAGGHTVADIRESSGISPLWLPYFCVVDTDLITERARNLAGEVADAPQDSPYGRWARLRDSQGASFCVVTPAPSG